MATGINCGRPINGGSVKLRPPAVAVKTETCEGHGATGIGRSRLPGEGNGTHREGQGVSSGPAVFSSKSAFDDAAKDLQTAGRNSGQDDWVGIDPG
jgi:hypothetical protein